MKHFVGIAACILMASVAGCAADNQGAEAEAIGQDESAFTVAERLGLPYGGEIKVIQAPFFSAAFASFNKPSKGCTTRGVGLLCYITECGSEERIEDGNAGNITVEGGAAPLTITANANNSYDNAFELGPNWFAPDASITVKAPGGPGVPGFRVSGLRLPKPVTVTSPSLEGELTINRSKPLDIKWTGNAGGSVSVTLDSQIGHFEAIPGQPGSELVSTSRTTINCAAPASLGKITLPSWALAKFAPGGEETFANGDVRTTSLIVGAETRRTSVLLDRNKPVRVVDTVVENAGYESQAQPHFN